MGRRKAGEAPAMPVEPPRRSSRLAVKDRVDYNEDRIFKQIVSGVSGKKTVSQRKTKKEKTKLTKAGVVAVRITHESSTTSDARGKTNKEMPASNKAIAASRMDSAAAVPTVASTTSAIDRSGVPILVTTPVSSRKDGRKAMRGPRLDLPVVEEEDLSMPSTSYYSATAQSDRSKKRSHTHGKLTPETSMIISPTSLKLRPFKGFRKEKSLSPDEVLEVPRGREPRGTTLFVEDDEEEEAAAAASAADYTMLADETLLVEDPPEAVVPEKKRKTEKDTVIKRNTVPTKDTVATKDAVAKTGRAVKAPSIMSTVVTSPMVNRKSRPRSMMRIYKEEYVTARQSTIREEEEANDQYDDAFANEIHTESTELERSMAIAEQIEAGTLAIEDLSPEDRIMAELFSPDKIPRTPRLEKSLRARRPLMLTSPSTDSKGKRKGRKAAAKARKSLTEDHFDSESDDSPSKYQRQFAPDEDADAKRSKATMRSRIMRGLFAAPPKKGDAPVVRKIPQPRQRKKIQYPGIAPLPVEEEEENTVFANPLAELDGIL